jgi:hypothetical protein
MRVCYKDDAYTNRTSANPASPERPQANKSFLSSSAKDTTHKTGKALPLDTQTSVPQRHDGAWRPELERTPADDNSNAGRQAWVRHPHTSALLYRILPVLALLRRGRRRGSPPVHRRQVPMVCLRPGETGLAPRGTETDGYSRFSVENRCGGVASRFAVC